MITDVGPPFLPSKNPNDPPIEEDDEDDNGNGDKKETDNRALDPLLARRVSHAALVFLVVPDTSEPLTEAAESQMSPLPR